MVWVQGSHVTIAGLRPGLMPWLLRRVQGLVSAWGRGVVSWETASRSSRRIFDLSVIDWPR